MDDIQKSELVISRILSLLMEWGIQECELRFSELQLDEEFAPFFFPCVEWLIDEGVIRASGIDKFLEGNAAGIVRRPVLTSFGMKILGRSVELEEGSISLSKAVREVSEQGRSFSQIGDFFGGLLGGFTKSMGS
ncbi:hypothetical protein KBY28_12495 [Ruegeria pomeroyi]|uniref:hypothetical protein n=1 Tax=Ruegeria pomeroyi TaxID=89184 RepID=UPI001F25E765|nr:hypothetical protein [Ruegeria pomeroyi]MCE8509263.1 hypothetical protein [Ruegeria pomeroyi]